jgi:hypothetical protein
VPLPYGTHVEWLRNVQAAGQTTIDVHCRHYTIDQPRVDDAARALPTVRAGRRGVWQRLGIKNYLHLQAVKTG